MKNMKIPARPAPSVEEARREITLSETNKFNQQTVKKKPPPRPPPPDLSKVKSNSTWNLSKQPDNISLIDWSPPNSPRSTTQTFRGSISSSFSSSSSSLASSKKSFECDNSAFNISPWNNIQFSANALTNTNNNSKNRNEVQTLHSHVSQMSVPTIIRPQQLKKNMKIIVPSRDTSPVPSSSRRNEHSGSFSPPMPLIPPPSPPKDVEETTVPFGIALYTFPGSHSDDLSLQENDIVILLRRINEEWLYGQVGDKEGMFPEKFIDIQVPLPDDDRIVTAVYAFRPQFTGDLELIPGQTINVLHRVSDEWLFGESNGQKGQFPINFVNRIPTNL